MNVLVTGGAGYIGSFVARHLRNDGHNVIIYDALRTGRGFAENCRGFELIEQPLSGMTEQLLRKHQIEAVCHLAAAAQVGESITNPIKYWENNVEGTRQLLEAMVWNGTSHLVFASSISTFGQPDKMPITEHSSQNPISPYGFTKYACEQMIDHYTAYGLCAVSLRFMNAAGGAANGDMGERSDPQTRLIPVVLEVAQGKRDCVEIFGSKHNTTDGTCVRDYVHVYDIARAHTLALDKIAHTPAPSHTKVNLGSAHARGYSVKQVIDVCQEITGRKIKVRYTAPRAGDPAVSYSHSDYAERALSWHPILNLRDIVRTQWKFMEKHAQ